MITHVVADKRYGFIYARDINEHPLTEGSAVSLADRLNQCMPGEYEAYELIPVSEIIEAHDHLDAIEVLIAAKMVKS